MSVGTDALRAQLLAIRASADAALALLGVPEPPTRDASAPCEHPANRRKALPVAGDLSQFQCLDCHALMSGKAAES